jgi:hypothetical protein
MGTEIEVPMLKFRLPIELIPAPISKVICAAALALAFAGSASAQAPPGPISGAPDNSQPPTRVSSRVRGRDASKGALAGDWKLNRNLSDDPRQKMEKATESSRGQVGVNGPWGGPGGGRRQPSGPGSGSSRAARQFADLMEDYAFLSITQTATTVRVTSDGGRLLAYYSGNDQASSKTDSEGNSKRADTQGSPNENPQGNSKPADPNGSKASSTRMVGDQLVVVSTRDGVKTTRTYAVSDDGSQLSLTTRVEGGHLKSPVTILFVYDPLGAGDDDDTP